MSGKGHPLPGSDEARHNEIPEHLERDKGRGDDPEAAVQPAQPPAAPDGEPYRYGDLGRGPGATSEEDGMHDERRNAGSGDGDAPRDQEQSGLSGGGRQVGGGPSPSDMAAPGGSSGEGGYGNAQNQQMHQGQQDGHSSVGSGDESLSRGERYDEQQGGGRGEGSASELQQDQQAHQDRGQSIAESEQRDD